MSDRENQGPPHRRATEPDTRPVTALPNLGPSMARLCAAAGLHTVSDLVTHGADAAYGRILAIGHRPHFMAFLALALGMQGRPLRDLSTREKPALRARYDALLAAHAADPSANAPANADPDALPPSLNRALDELGLGPAKSAPGPRDPDAA